MAKARVTPVPEVRDVELSPNARALVTPKEVVLILGWHDAVRLTLREAQVLAGVVGTTDKVNLQAGRSG